MTLGTHLACLVAAKKDVTVTVRVSVHHIMYPASRVALVHCDLLQWLGVSCFCYGSIRLTSLQWT